MKFVLAGCELCLIQKYHIHSVYEDNTSRVEDLRHLDLHLARIAFEQEEIIILSYQLIHGTCYCFSVLIMTAAFNLLVASTQ